MSKGCEKWLTLMALVSAAGAISCGPEDQITIPDGFGTTVSTPVSNASGSTVITFAGLYVSESTRILTNSVQSGSRVRAKAYIKTNPYQLLNVRWTRYFPSESTILSDTGEDRASIYADAAGNAEVTSGQFSIVDPTAVRATVTYGDGQVSFSEKTIYVADSSLHPYPCLDFAPTITSDGTHTYLNLDAGCSRGTWLGGNANGTPRFEWYVAAMRTGSNYVTGSVPTSSLHGTSALSGVGANLIGPSIDGPINPEGANLSVRLNVPEVDLNSSFQILVQLAVYNLARYPGTGPTPDILARSVVLSLFQYTPGATYLNFVENTSCFPWFFQVPGEGLTFPIGCEDTRGI